MFSRGLEQEGAMIRHGPFRSTGPSEARACLLRAALATAGVLGILIGACNPTPTEAPTPADEFVFGVIMVGPQDDHGWSEAHYRAGLYVEANIPNARMIDLDCLNPDDRPETTLEEAVGDMVAEGARVIFLTSDEYAVETAMVAQQHPDVVFIHTTGDHALVGGAPPNVGNIMARMVYGKMIAGCVAALSTDTGVIGYLGPLINDETRRLVNAAFLGARYCYEHYREGDPAEMRFRVQWIGYWFYIPGVTYDPIQLCDGLYGQGADVILSGIDTTEVLTVAAERAAAGEQVWAVPYDYEGACEEAPHVCLGVPYYNWGPGYLRTAREVIAGTWTQRWEWLAPDWEDINSRDASSVGFLNGPAISASQEARLQEFIGGLADESIVLFQGPLSFQDGSTYLAEGEVATDEQVWYMPQLLAGMEGLSD
jgi:simple sugar transport system substrate-binding protein